MERHNMLTIPLKTTNRFDLSPTLSAYLKESRTLPNPSQCRDGLMRISALRNCLSSSICTRTAHVNAIAEHALRDASEYHAALLELESLGFPLDEGKIVGLRVEWECAFRKGEQKTVRSNLLYERTCVLFDVAAMESHLASQSDFSTKDGLKFAIAHYNTAAGIISNVRNNDVVRLDPDPSTDLTPVCLEMCETLMLAQSQACIYDVATLSPTPNHSILAKLATGVAELYAEGWKLCQDRILSKMTEGDEWTNHVQAKSLLFKGLAEYHQGVVDRVARKYGHEIARLTGAMEFCDRAARYGEKCEFGRAEIDAFRKMMDQRKLVAEKDNREVFKESIPSPRYIDSIPGIRMAKLLPLPSSLTTLNKPLFSDMSIRARIL